MFHPARPSDSASRLAKRRANSTGMLYVVFWVATSPMRSVTDARAASCVMASGLPAMSVERMSPRFSRIR